MAPLCKGLLLVLNGLTVMLTLLPQYQEVFLYNLQAITQQHQVWLQDFCLPEKGGEAEMNLNFSVFSHPFPYKKHIFFN